MRVGWTYKRAQAQAIFPDPTSAKRILSESRGQNLKFLRCFVRYQSTYVQRASIHKKCSKCRLDDAAVPGVYIAVRTRDSAQSGVRFHLSIPISFHRACPRRGLCFVARVGIKCHGFQLQGNP
jgi:hypothetical protein